MNSIIIDPVKKRILVVPRVVIAVSGATD